VTAPGTAWLAPAAAAPTPPVWRLAADILPACAALPDPTAPGAFAPGDNGFIALCQAYRASGGIARGDDMAHWMAGRGQGSSLHLAALIVGRDAFSFQWRDTFWVPMFQFSPLHPAWGEGARQVLGELGPVLDGWSLAAWFATGNGWLANRRPLDLLTSNLPLVLAAAHADRDAIKG
jgi:hypothetical protein